MHAARFATIVTVTLNPALDVWATTALVAPERKLHCTDAEYTPGGGGINVARALRQLGVEARALFPSGGSTGELLCDLLLGEGTAIEPIPVAGTTRESLAVREAATGRYFRFVLPGPVVTHDELERCIAVVRRRVTPQTLVVISGSLPEGMAPERLALVIAAAQEAGAAVIVDTSGAALDVAARCGVLLLKPSLNELRRHAGRDLPTDAAIVEAACALRDLGPTGAVLVSLGSAGALLVSRGEPAIFVAAPIVPIVSAVGAGDSLVAGVALALQRGCDLQEAARWGVAAGTAATLSADHALCDRADMLRLLSLVPAVPAEPSPESPVSVGQ
jgi:6-phosphofructokinase 2